MNSSNYITPFWIQNINGSSWTLSLYARNSGSSHGDLDWTIDVEYSTDLLTWSDFGTTPTIINNSISRSFSANQRVYLRSKTQCTHWGKYDVSTSRYWYIQILSNQQHSVGGNIMSLIYGPNFTGYEKIFPDDTLMGIFQGLFYSNTYLVDAGELVLPVTHATSPCPPPDVFVEDAPLNRVYRSMFERCTSLVNGPHIDLRGRGARDLPYALQRMFNGCTSLMSFHTCLQSENRRYNQAITNITTSGVLFNYSGTSDSIKPSSWTNNNIISMYLPTYDRVVDWHSSVSGTVYQVTDTNNTRVIWKKTSPRPGYGDPFWIENVSNDDGYVEFKGHDSYGSTLPSITVQYRINGGSLGSITVSGTTPKYVSIPANTKIEFYAETTTWSDAGYPYVGINILNTNYSTHTPDPPSVNIGGNILSMIYGTSFINYSSLPNTALFYQWLMGCTVVDASNLCLFEPRSGGCYESMFSSCVRLISAPLLPFMNLTDHCYRHMFAYCTSLTTAPALPATALIDYCYQGMFQSCTALTTAPVLSATTLDEWCYSDMFMSCTSLTTAPALPATNIAGACYHRMFYGCTSLTTAPVLSATTLDEWCYYQMFSNCTSLNNVTCLATNMNFENATYEWLDNVYSTGTFTKAVGATWPTGVSGIPSGWTVVEA